MLCIYFLLPEYLQYVVWVFFFLNIYLKHFWNGFCFLHYRTMFHLFSTVVVFAEQDIPFLEN